jgi:hypothetical protein
MVPSFGGERYNYNFVEFHMFEVIGKDGAAK